MIDDQLRVLRRGHHARTTPRSSTDREIVARIRDAGPDSDEYRALTRDLVELVAGTLMTMQRDGRLFSEILRQCRIPLPAPPPDYRSHAADVIRYAACEAVPRFMVRYLLCGEWDPERASLRTCCVRAGLLAFVDQYRYFCEERRPGFDLPGDEELALLPDRRRTGSPAHAADPERRALDRDAIRRHLAGAGERVTTMVVMTADGYGQPDIAATLGITPDAVSSALRRFRAGLARD